MPISRDEASRALASVERVERLASIWKGYESGAPHFFLWGGIWILGYGFAEFRPELAGIAWLALDAVGILGSFLIGRACAARRPGAASGYGARYGACAATFVVLLAAILFILPPHEDAQVAALPPLLVATAYTLRGIFRGARWAVAGIALGALTIVGFAAFRPYFMLWMAVVGGATLVATGLWLRSA